MSRGRTDRAKLSVFRSRLPLIYGERDSNVVLLDCFFVLSSLKRQNRLNFHLNALWKRRNLDASPSWVRLIKNFRHDGIDDLKVA